MNAQAQTPAAAKPAKAGKTPKAAKPAKAGKDHGTKKPPVKAAKPAKAPAAPKAPRVPTPLSGKSTDALRLKAPSYHHDKERKTAGGHVSVDNGDKLAAQLRGSTLDQVYAFAAKTLGEAEKDLRTKYAHLNVGMQRMNLGNRCRAELGLTKKAEKAAK